MISLIKDITVWHSVMMRWNDIASVAYSTESSLAIVCYNITPWHQCVIKQTNALESKSSMLLIYIQMHSKWWNETMNTQSTMESIAKILQMDGSYKHLIIGMNKQLTGVRGRDRLSIGHASGRGRGGVKPGLVGSGVLWDQSHRYCLAMQRRANRRPVRTAYSLYILL